MASKAHEASLAAALWRDVYASGQNSQLVDTGAQGEGEFILVRAGSAQTFPIVRAGRSAATGVRACCFPVPWQFCSALFCSAACEPAVAELPCSALPCSALSSTSSRLGRARGGDMPRCDVMFALLCSALLFSALRCSC